MEDRVTSAQLPGRAAYRDIELYSPNRSPASVDLSDNTNLWGTPPAAVDAMVQPQPARYPSLYAADLKDALAGYTGLSPNMITTGCGSDDVIDSAMRAFAEPGMAVAFSEPTFHALPVFVRMNALRPLVLPLESLPRSGARIIYVCSPNNPTGSLTPRESVERLLRETSADQVVMVDEAYAEFADENMIDLVPRYARLLVIRTMSKAFGLAGLRVGYALGQPELVAEVEKSRGPYKVSAVAERAAIAALSDGWAWVAQHVSLAVENRARLTAELRKRGFEPITSEANFVFVPVTNSAGISSRMRENGVAVRAFDDPEGLRITVGPWWMLEKALDAFDEARR
jgi:histidinol-phosphate aminotransferase